MHNIWCSFYFIVNPLLYSFGNRRILLFQISSYINLTNKYRISENEYPRAHRTWWWNLSSSHMYSVHLYGKGYSVTGDCKMLSNECTTCRLYLPLIMGIWWIPGVKSNLFLFSMLPKLNTKNYYDYLRQYLFSSPTNLLDATDLNTGSI